MKPKHRTLANASNKKHGLTLFYQKQMQNVQNRERHHLAHLPTREDVPRKIGKMVMKFNKDIK